MNHFYQLTIKIRFIGIVWHCSVPLAVQRIILAQSKLNLQTEIFKQLTNIQNIKYFHKHIIDKKPLTHANDKKITEIDIRTELYLI